MCGKAGFCGHVRSSFGIPSVVGFPLGFLLEGDMFDVRKPSWVLWVIDVKDRCGCRESQ